MPSTNLHGPHDLEANTIDNVVRGIGPGAYALGRDTPKSFIVEYVGRSDTDLSDRLKRWVGKKYPHFKYGFFPSAKDAFLKECNLFHDFGETSLDNKVHPGRSEGSNWICPRCRGLG
jgi:hypothetical protein